MTRNLERWSVGTGCEELVGLRFKELLCSPVPFFGSWEFHQEKRNKNRLCAG